MISNAATGNENVKALVYLAAFLLTRARDAVDLSGKFPGSTLGDALRRCRPRTPTAPGQRPLHPERRVPPPLAADVRNGRT
ncbi:hypothetical protein [Streptomyces sp. KL116D]|uniref:hypothetical protein n=1 Tax=Streptomyces sp. KL116D TaxID=3045152 RepID=UPI003558CD57